MDPSGAIRLLFPAGVASKAPLRHTQLARVFWTARMWNFDAFAIPGINFADSAVSMPLWVAGIALALLMLFLLLALLRSGAVGTLVFLVLVAVAIGGGWFWYERERAEERRAIETRLMELNQQALASGSVLACLDGLSGDAVESGCERVLFANPETLAAASSYTAARIAILSNALGFASRRDPDLERGFDGLRRALEQDRFGVVANVLAVQNGCTAERCDTLILLRDPTRVRANLRERTFDGIVARHAANWGQASRTGTASSAANGKSLPSGYSLPSAASIPPVSIMNNEPASTAPSAASPA